MNLLTRDSVIAIWCMMTTVIPCVAQSPVFLDDIHDKVTVYDTDALQQLPLLNIGVVTFEGGIDTNFIGVVDPKQSFRRLLDYPFPNSQLQSGWDDLFFMSPVNNSDSWYTAKIDNSLGQPLEPTDLANISILDRELNETHVVTMGISYTYLFNGQNYPGIIRFDSHDRNAFEWNGTLYVLAIGTRLEYYDAGESWIDQDSMLVRFTSVHVLDAETGEEMARWDPQSQGFRMEDFGQSFHLRLLPNGLRHYSHPHVNVINPYVDSDGAGVSIFASARHPGTVTKLRWDGISNVLEPEWMFGVPPHGQTPPFYFPTVTANNLNAPHGSSAFVDGDTTYVATYNNKPDYPAIGGTHQVYKVYDGQAHLMWQSPDIGVRSICKGDAKWSADGRFLLTTHGNCDGAMVADDGMGGTVETMNYEKFVIWNPWNNSKVLGIFFYESMYAALMDFVDEEKMLDFNPITYFVDDSVRLSHSHPDFAYWTVGYDKVFTTQLALPLEELGSLSSVSAWIRTGDTGVWRVDDKEALITTVSETAPVLLRIPTIQTIGSISLPGPYRWAAIDLLGRRMDANCIQAPGIYILEATDSRNALAYRERHVYLH